MKQTVQTLKIREEYIWKSKVKTNLLWKSARIFPTNKLWFLYLKTSMLVYIFTITGLDIMCFQTLKLQNPSQKGFGALAILWRSKYRRSPLRMSSTLGTIHILREHLQGGGSENANLCLFLVLKTCFKPK